jgi:hypothetical protein
LVTIIKIVATIVFKVVTHPLVPERSVVPQYKVGIEGTQVLVYLDDMIILSATFSQHLAHLRSCFDRMKQFKLRINRSKCHFGCLEVKYLGHRITPEGIQTNPDKIESILRTPPPVNVKQLLTFMPTCNWYRRFIPKFAEIARPLTSLTKKDAAWELLSGASIRYIEESFDNRPHLTTSRPRYSIYSSH